MSSSEPQLSFSIIGQSPAIMQVFNLMAKVAATDANVLLLGENGTGKELIARALHEKSQRKEQPFISVDMGAITESLFESELFGHVKGAFTDARENRKGRFEMAHTGTLFLDEIGNLSLPLQAKLLTALQQRKIVRVGANAPIPVDIRLVSATNLPLYAQVAAKAFRQDLLYRLNTVEIHLPPLRERTEDIPLLVRHYLERYTQQYHKSINGITASAMKRLRAYSWPGNVRELQHAVERAVILCESPKLKETDFQFSGTLGVADSWNLPSYNLAEIEREVIARVLDRHARNISRSAAELGISRAALYRRMEQYGLK